VQRYSELNESKRSWAMGSKWEVRLLSDLVDNFDAARKPVKGLDRRTGPYPYYGASGVVDKVDKYLFDGEYLLIAEDGENLRTRNTPIAFIARDKFWVNNHAHIVRGNSKADTRFLMYALSAADISGYLTGSTMPKLTQGNMNRIPLLTPPLPEQKAIAHILGTLDDKIELNRKMNETLEAMARALFKSWFIDFDPVRAKLNGRKPVGMDAATAALFPAHLQITPEGKIPTGWRYATINELCSVNSWTLGKTDKMHALEYVEISEVNRGNIAKIQTYERGEEPSRARRRIRHGDTVLSTVRPDRRSYFLALNPPINRVVSTGFAVLTPTKVPWTLIHTAMIQEDVSDHLGQMADGGAYPAVRPEIIGAWQIATPNHSGILDVFHRFCKPLFEKIESKRSESHTLTGLRNALLSKLLSGEISVDSIDQSLRATYS